MRWGIIIAAALLVVSVYGYFSLSERGVPITGRVVGDSQTEQIQEQVQDVQKDLKENKQQTHFVYMRRDYNFDPEELRIKPGDKVVWVHDSNEGKKLQVFSKDLKDLDSGYMFEGDTYEYTFNKPGEYKYFCGTLAWMQGKIIVE